MAGTEVEGCNPSPSSTTPLAANPAVSSRSCAACDVVEYIRTPPDRATLECVLGLLDAPPTQLVRRDKRFAELGLDDAACATAAQVVEVLIAHPELMERPVVVCGERAVIGRPPEKVLELLD